MAHLHEILAVEGTLEGKAKAIIQEAEKVFAERHQLFQGRVRTLTLFTGDDATLKEAQENAERQEQQIVTTVNTRLSYVWDSIVPWLDAVLQKETTNQTARADVVVDGNVVLQQVPVTFLLGLESKLRVLREMYVKLPTLDVAIPWVAAPDMGQDIVKSPEVTTLKQEKSEDHIVVVQPTDRHPAQVVTKSVNKTIGAYKLTVTSGMITPSTKSLWLSRIDKLLQAVKQARQRANEAELIDAHSGQVIHDFIHA